MDDPGTCKETLTPSEKTIGVVARKQSCKTTSPVSTAILNCLVVQKLLKQWKLINHLQSAPNLEEKTNARCTLRKKKLHALNRDSRSDPFF